MPISKSHSLTFNYTSMELKDSRIPRSGTDPFRLLLRFLAIAILATPTSLRAAPQDAGEQDVEARLRVEMRGERAVWVEWVGMQRPNTPSLALENGAGVRIPITALLPNTASASLLVPESPLDPTRVYFVIDKENGLRGRARRDPWFRTLYSDKPLGAIVSTDNKTTDFRLFAPRADSVRLFLYHDAFDRAEEAAMVVSLERDRDGVWETTQLGDHHGVYYDYTIHGPPDPGNWFFETNPVHVSDPYALVSVDSYGKSRVWVDEAPPPPVMGGRPAMESVVAYEVHIQDFTDALPVPSLAGTLPAMSASGLTNSNGDPVGFDYLVDLGINVVHLMPMQEYLHYPDEAWQKDMGSDPFARTMGIDRENYQWGYRTTHTFAVESRFRSRDSDWGSERRQFQDLVRAFHERGIAVIIDVIPNHTGENMDGRHLLFNFNAIDLPYYYRTNDEVGHIGPYGNEVKSEDRPMVQRWIVDQLRHWVDVLGVDGFRIDLAGQIDEQTLRFLKTELPEDLIIYGEPWIAVTDLDVRANPDWAWYKADAPITFFQDDARDAFKGSPFDLEARGWAGGDASARDRLIQALSNGYDEEPSPNDGISYLDIHDNWALSDRYATQDNDGRQGVDEASLRLAAGLLLTSLGPVVLHGGTEMMRSKGLAPMEAFEKTVAGGPIWFKGRGDTYNLRHPNTFLWDSLAKPEVGAMRDFWKGLIALRASEYGRVFRTASPPEHHFAWFTPDDRSLLGYVVGGSVAVVVNVGQDSGDVEIELPEGSWRLVSNGERIDHRQGVEGNNPSLSGGSHSLRVSPQTQLIWVKD